MHADERLDGLMGPGGIQDCGKAQNCVQVCPKEIPLTTSIAAMNRDVTKLVVKDLFFKDEETEAASGPGRPDQPGEASPRRAALRMLTSTAHPATGQPEPSVGPVLEHPAEPLGPEHVVVQDQDGQREREPHSPCAPGRPPGPGGRPRAKRSASAGASARRLVRQPSGEKSAVA